MPAEDSRRRRRADTSAHVHRHGDDATRASARWANTWRRCASTSAWTVPLSADHFGHIGVNSCIRLGKGLEKYNLAWLEDMVPWQYTDLLKKITDAVDIPILTGEDIYLKEPFIELCRKHAVDIIHPDLATSGGILETKKIGDAAQEYGVPMAMHFAGTPVSCMANVHCAAATENFLVLENHSVDVPWWDDLVEGVEKPIVNKGYITVPEKPGLGITLNEAAVKQHLLEPGYFEPTPEWNTDRTNDRSMELKGKTNEEQTIRSTTAARRGCAAAPGRPRSRTRSCSRSPRSR